jgi:tetratricopeptide (TPR) repeat protein
MERTAVNGKDLSGYADSRLTIWSDLVGVEVIHSDRGSGTIVKVQQRQDYLPLIQIKFVNEICTFNPNSFKDGKAELFIPADLASKVKHWAVEKEKAEALEQVKREVLERKKAEIFDNYGSLAKKYNVSSIYLWEEDSSSPLVVILDKLESQSYPSQAERDWLKLRKLHNLLATVYYRDYLRTDDIWQLVKTCSNLREAKLPKKVIQITESVTLSDNQDKRAIGALWTTRGAAFRDLNDLESAKKCAKQAIQVSPDSYHPYNLAGAISYELNEPVQGYKYFDKAIRLGSTSKEQESTIREALRRSTREVRRQVADYLFAKDPIKYGWVKGF